MLLIPCPYCGERPEIEFSYGGQAHRERPQRPADLSDEEWSRHIYVRDSPRGRNAERWRHLRGCGRFFNVIRDTTTDRIAAAYGIGEPPP
jgi:sarcosine oxidase subunit delta